MGRARSWEGIIVYYRQSLSKYLTVIKSSYENVLLVKPSKVLLLPDKESFLVGVCRMNFSSNEKNKSNIIAI